MTPTPQQIRLAVAKTCPTSGWYDLNCVPDNECWDDCSQAHQEMVDGLPNYPESLDAMHEVEKTLTTPDERLAYRRSLCTQVGGCNTNLKSFGQITASPTARCLAYLAVKGVNL